MSDRQRGAAHVPVMVFLLTLILFFGALGFGYVTLEKNGELESAVATAREDLDEAKNENFFLKHYIEDVSAEVGEAGEWKGRPGFNYEEYKNPSPLQNVALPTGVKKAIADFAVQAGVSEAQGISSFFGHISAELDAKKGRITALESEQTKLEGNLVSLQTALDTIKSERATEVASLNDQLSAKDRDYQAEIDNKTDLLARSVKEVGDVRDQLTTTREDARKESVKLNGEIHTQQQRNVALGRKIALVNAPQDADGQIIEASAAAGRAWVNIGRNDMLTVGTTFRITNADSNSIKAYGTVSRVEADRAELVVTGVQDPFDYPRTADDIKNDLYSPNLRRTIYLMGRFGHPYSKPQVKEILKRLGNDVVDTLGPQVDLVLLGNDEINEDGSGFVPVTETEAYQIVSKFGIETATLNKVRDFLKLGD